MGGQDQTEDRAVELARAERALRESEERFRLIADSAPVPMWVTALDRTRWFVNRAYAEFLGVSYEEALTFDWRAVLHPDDYQRILKEQVEKEAQLAPFELEARYRGGHGGWCWLRSVSQPRWGPDGEHAGFIGVAFDISMAKEAEHTLQRQVDERTAELQALYERTPTILQSLNSEGRLVSVSDRWLEFMGYEHRDEVLGRLVSEFATPESLKLFYERDWPTLLAGGEVTDAPYQTVKRSGEIADVLISSRVLRDGQGHFVRTMGAIQDVTERLRTEEALRQAQKVEAMGQLTGGVAHDFNNLLSPILGGLDMLKRRGVGDARDQRTIAGALESAERARLLVQRLLGFARRQPLTLTAVSPATLVEGMRELIASTVGPRIRLVIEAGEDLPCCRVDANQIEMALLNLSVNARDAMPNGGTLTISAAADRIDRDSAHLKAGDYVRLSVADTGAGMDAVTLARAIEPFFSTKAPGQGTGLGLSMVHGLAAQLGGTMRLDSKPGDGTTVTLWLPFEEAGEASPQALAEAAPVRAGTVLLVDDEPLVRRSTAEMLEGLGWRVVECDSGAAALARLSDRQSFELLVTDHQMPDMTGTELSQTVRRRRPDLPILMITGYTEDQPGEAGPPRLIKPFRQDDLNTALSALLG